MFSKHEVKNGITIGARKLLPILIAAALSPAALADVAGAPSGSGVEPDLVNLTVGNAQTECRQAGQFTYSCKIDSWSETDSKNGDHVCTFPDGHTNTISIVNSDGIHFDWAATNTIGAVIVKGGNGANIYGYTPQQYSDTGLHAPEKVTPQGENKGAYAVSHTSFCWNPDADKCYADETGWSAGSRYVKKGNWATYTPYEGSAKSVKLYAGQTMDAGTVSYSAPFGGNVTITIQLNSGWYFGADKNTLTGTVHIQGYEAAPSGNPAPGLFAYKAPASGTLVIAVVPESSFYGVHAELLRVAPCPVTAPAQ